MEITKVQAIYFSGTGTTRKLCAAVAGGTGLADDSPPSKINP